MSRISAHLKAHRSLFEPVADSPVGKERNQVCHPAAERAPTEFGHVAEPHEHQILGGNNHRELSLKALCLESVARGKDGRAVRRQRLPVGLP